MSNTQEISTVKKRKFNRDSLAFKIGEAIVLAIIVGSLALALSCIGKTLPPPFENNSKIVNPIQAVINSACEDTTDPQTVPDKYKNSTFAMLNYGGSYLSIITKDWTLFTENEISGVNFDVDLISSVAIYGEDVYLSTATLTDDKSMVEHENIIRTNIYGECQEIIYELKNEAPANGVFQKNNEDVYKKTNRIQDVKVVDDKLTFCELSPYAITVKEIPVEINTKDVTDEQNVLATYHIDTVVSTVSYSPQNKSAILLDSKNNVYSCDESKTQLLFFAGSYCAAVNQAPNGDVIVLNYNENPIKVYRDSLPYLPDDKSNIINYAETDNLTWGQVLLDGYGNIISVGDTISFNWFYSLKIYAKWLSILILVACAICLIAALIRSQIRLARKGLFHEVTVAVLIGVTCLVIVLFYSVYFAQATVEQTITKVSEQTNIAYSSLSQEDKDSLADSTAFSYTQDTENASEAEDIKRVSQTITTEFAKDSNIYMYSCYARDSQTNNFYCIADSEKALHVGLEPDSLVEYNGETKTLSEMIQSYLAENKAQSGETLDFEGEDIRGHYYCSLKFIYDSNDYISGIITFRTYFSTTIEPIMNEIYMIAFIVLVCYLVFLVAYLEIRRMSISIRNYKRERHPRGSDKAKKSFVNLIRPLSFVISLAFGADSALAVLVSKKLFDSSEIFADATAWGLQDFMYGLPITLTCAGLVCGIILFTKLEKRFAVKRIFVLSSMLFTASFLFSTYACMSNFYIMFVVAKFMIGFSCGCMKAELYTFTTVKEDEDERKNLLRDIGRAGMPAVVISTLTCGYLATIVDYYILYLFAAICSIFVLVLAIIFIPRRSKFVYDKKCFLLTRSSKFRSTKEIVRWIFSPQVLMVILLVIVPFAITKGYKSYMFPLYSSGVGMDKATISIIYSMATMVSFLLVYVISDFNNRFTDSRKVINALCILGFVFVLFRANSRVEWAIVAMFLTTIFGRTFGSAFRMGLARMCEKDGLNKSQIQPYIYLIEEVCNALQVVLCGLLTTIGGKYACVVFGVYCLVSALLFGILVGRTYFDARVETDSGCKNASTQKLKS